MKRKRRAKAVIVWGLIWHAENKMDGVNRHIIFDAVGKVKTARTRREIRDYAQERYGYIKRRPDLRAEPHGWRFPQPVRIRITEI